MTHTGRIKNITLNNMRQIRGTLNSPLFLFTLLLTCWFVYSPAATAEEKIIERGTLTAEEVAPAEEEPPPSLEDNLPETYSKDVQARISKVVTSKGVTIHSPFNYAYVAVEELTLVGETTNPLRESITITVNGVAGTALIEQNYFHFVLQLNLGENVIEIDDARLMVYYYTPSQKIHRPKAPSPVPEQYLKFEFHSNIEAPECLGCHQLGPEIAGVSLCYEKCHMRVLKNSWAHGPTGEYRCLACHDPFGDKTGYGMILTGKELCLSCHMDMTPSKSHVHSALTEGLCLGCHDAHSTKYKKVLRHLGGKLCYACHEEKTKPQEFYRGKAVHSERGGEEYEYPHPPVEDGQCLHCHDPHESDYRANLKKSPSIICTNFDCHGTLDRSPIDGKMAGHLHPFDKDPSLSFMAKVPKEIKLGETKLVVCYSCHTPHGSNRKSFLIMEIGSRQRGEQLCGKCHPPVDTIGGGEVELSIERDED